MLRSLLFKSNNKQSLPSPDEILFPTPSKQVNHIFDDMSFSTKQVNFGKWHVIVIVLENIIGRVTGKPI